MFTLSITVSDGNYKRFLFRSRISHAGSAVSGRSSPLQRAQRVPDHRAALLSLFGKWIQTSQPELQINSIKVHSSRT